MDGTTALKGLLVLVIISGLVAGTLILNSDDEIIQANTTTNTTQSAELGVSSGDVNTYENGSYTAIGSYTSPGGDESVEVTVELASGVVKTVNVVSQATHPTSKQFQASFVRGIAELVAGVKLDDANVDKVAASSLTSRGFNQALDDIRTQAQAE